MANFSFEIPSISQIKAKYNDPDKYILSEELVSAVKVAMTLGQPLFITGEPGTGKTQLAFKIAHHFQLKNDKGECRPFIFNTKTTSSAQDLFYTYDAVRHFQDANIKGNQEKDTSEYIELQALGKAIALSNPDLLADKSICKGFEGEARHSVVLVDEIDKAPTDFPNDILYEIEHMSFRIKELGKEVMAGQNFRPIIIMTSNSEKNLPAAFLRRCVFYHIPFPGKEQLLEIVRTQLGEDSQYADSALVNHFLKIREMVKKKRPATAELIAWLRMLESEQFLNQNKSLANLSDEQKKLLRFSYSVLAKDKDDLKILEQEFM
ncbi:MAG: MoxR family ATPase [Bacteroidia bacterium]|nr:MoxR family ATPase [Bacteroidia bacterium]